MYDPYFDNLKLIHLLSMCNVNCLETYAYSLNLYFIVGNTISLENEF